MIPDLLDHCIFEPWKLIITDPNLYLSADETPEIKIIETLLRPEKLSTLYH